MMQTGVRRMAQAPKTLVARRAAEAGCPRIYGISGQALMAPVVPPRWRWHRGGGHGTPFVQGRWPHRGSRSGAGMGARDQLRCFREAHRVGKTRWDMDVW